MSVVFSPEARQVQNLIRERAGLQPLPDPDTMLYCTHCKSWKPDEDFYMNRNKAYISRRSRSHWCKVCDMRAKRSWRARNVNEEKESWRRRARIRRDTDVSNMVTCVCGYEFTARGLNFHKLYCNAGLDRQADV